MQNDTKALNPHVKHKQHEIEALKTNIKHKRHDIQVKTHYEQQWQHAPLDFHFLGVHVFLPSKWLFKMEVFWT